jgi:hypothetical protein
VQRAADRTERIVLVAQLLLRWLPALVAEVPDLVRQRQLLRAQQY